MTIKIKIGQKWTSRKSGITDIITSIELRKGKLVCFSNNYNPPEHAGFDKIDENGYGECLSFSEYWKLIYDPYFCEQDCCRAK